MLTNLKKGEKKRGKKEKKIYRTLLRGEDVEWGGGAVGGLTCVRSMAGGKKVRLWSMFYTTKGGKHYGIGLMGQY